MRARVGGDLDVNISVPERPPTHYPNAEFWINATIRATLLKTVAGAFGRDITIGDRWRLTIQFPESGAQPENIPTLPDIAPLTATVGQPIDIELPAASFGDPPLVYTLAPLPEGLSFNPATRRLFDVPSSAGAFQLIYRVTDVDGDTAQQVFDVVIGEAGNARPTANAGPNRNVAAGASVSLDGTGSFDPDGAIVSYAWIQLLGDNVALGDADTVTPDFTAPITAAPQTLRFELVVTDNGGLTHTDTVDIFVAAQVVIDPDIQVDDSTLDVTEGSTVNIRVRLTSQPASPVTVTATESSALISIAAPVVLISPANWSVYRDIAVAAAPDSVTSDTPVNVLLTATGGSTDTADVVVTVRNEAVTPNLQVDDSTLDVTEGSTVNIRVRLTSQPASPVTVTATESSALISIAAPVVLISPANWSVYRDIAVAAAPDSVTSDTPVNVLLTATGGSIDTADVVVTVRNEAVSAPIRANSLAAIDMYFDRDSSSQSAGRWTVRQAGSTASGSTGPGRNTAGPYVYCETSGSAPSNIAERSMLEAHPTTMLAWTGSGRIFAARLCMQGDGFDANSAANLGGVEIVTAGPGEAFSAVALIHGWAYSDSRDAGDMFDDFGGETLTCAQIGGWVDFEIPIPDTATAFGLRVMHGEGAEFHHDSAMWQFEFRNGT